jgi:hypothetical protein
MNTESQAVFMDFDDFAYGDMVAECRCGGVMEKRQVRPFPETSAVVDLAVCNRCGATWDGRIE